eukprot:359085-Chlamydomonas_euryale.AAC.3
MQSPQRAYWAPTVAASMNLSLSWQTHSPEHMCGMFGLPVEIVSLLITSHGRGSRRWWHDVRGHRIATWTLLPALQGPHELCNHAYPFANNGGVRVPALTAGRLAPNRFSSHPPWLRCTRKPIG